MADHRKYIVHVREWECYVKPEFLDKITEQRELTTCDKCKYHYTMYAENGTHIFCTNGCFKPVDLFDFCSMGRPNDYDDYHI